MSLLVHACALCVTLCRDIVDLHAIQTDMAGLVNDQGVDIDKIGKVVAAHSPTLSVPMHCL